MKEKERTGKTVLTVSNITKNYEDKTEYVTALSNINFSIFKGESVAIVGPSGSGKTTLLEIMGGLSKPSNGEVLINGVNVHHGSDAEISHFRNTTIGFVFQLMHLQDYFTAWENVSLPLIAAGVTSADEIKEKSLELLKKVGLEHRANHYPKALSGGEMQRVAIARALANSPEIILADEPTGKLDKENAHKVMDLLHGISQEGKNLIMITHDESIAAEFPRSIELAHGVLKKDTTKRK